jgi:hypothetical protein
MLLWFWERSDRMLLRFELRRWDEGEEDGGGGEERGCEIQSSDRSSMKSLRAAGRAMVMSGVVSSFWWTVVAVVYAV